MRCDLIRSSRGSVSVSMAATLAALVSLVALTIDVGYALVARNELHNIADAAVLAGARQLGRIYEGKTWQEQQNYVLSSGDRAAVEQAMNEVAARNQAAGLAITIASSDVQIGTWDFTNRSMTVTDTHPTAVRGTARRDSNANGPIVTFAAAIMGITSLEVSAKATAALSGIASAAPGELDLPIGISKYWFTQQETVCGQQIKFNPTGTLEGCAGWNTFTNYPANNNTLRTILEGMADGTCDSSKVTCENPETVAGETVFNFIGGNLGNQAFSALLELFNAKKDENGEWKTFVVVYDWDDCSNPHGPIPIVGFATAVVTQVLPPPDMTIQATIYCDLVEQGRSGGTNYGTLASIPGLVE